MKLELNEERRLLQETVRRFVQDRTTPEVEERDGNVTVPRELLAELADMGLLGITVSADWEGAALGLEDVAVVVHELARGDAGLALAVAHHNVLAAGHLDGWASRSLKDERLAALARGECLGAWAHTEAGGSAAGAVQTRAEQDGGHWVLEGGKVAVPLGSVADLFIVTAAGPSGLTAFAVDGDASGLRRVPQADPLGARTAGMAALELSRVRVLDHRRVGDVGHASDQVASLLERASVIYAALAVGLGRTAVAAAASYANERKQFGRPIGSFQAIQWKLADAATEVDAAALLVHRAASLADRGRPFASDAAMARLLAGQAARHAADHAVQIHGGFGYTTDFPAARIYRDAELLSVLGGARHEHRATVARSVLERASR